MTILSVEDVESKMEVFLSVEVVKGHVRSQNHDVTKTVDDVIDNYRTELSCHLSFSQQSCLKIKLFQSLERSRSCCNCSCCTQTDCELSSPQHFCCDNFGQSLDHLQQTADTDSSRGLNVTRIVTRWTSVLSRGGRVSCYEGDTYLVTR